MTHGWRTAGRKEERLRMCGARVRAEPRLAIRKAGAHVRQDGSVGGRGRQRSHANLSCVPIKAAVEIDFPPDRSR